MPDRDPVEVEAEALMEAVEGLLIKHDVDMMLSDEAGNSLRDALVVLARTEANRAGEAMREAAARWHDREAAELQKECDLAWPEYVPELGLHAIKVHKRSALVIREMSPHFPLSDAPVSPWRTMDSAPHGVRVLLAWQDWRDGTWCQEVGYASQGERYDNGYSSISHHGSATHWQHLPTPPAKDD